MTKQSTMRIVLAFFLLLAAPATGGKARGEKMSAEEAVVVEPDTIFGRKLVQNSVTKVGPATTVNSQEKILASALRVQMIEEQMIEGDEFWNRQLQMSMSYGGKKGKMKEDKEMKEHKGKKGKKGSGDKGKKGSGSGSGSGDSGKKGSGSGDGGKKGSGSSDDSPKNKKEKYDDKEEKEDKVTKGSQDSKSKSASKDESKSASNDEPESASKDESEEYSEDSADGSYSKDSSKKSKGRRRRGLRRVD